MPGQEGIGAKTCVVCGKDAAGLPRVKDTQGRYYHKECREAVKRKLAAQGAAPVTSSPTAPKGPRVAPDGARPAAAPPRVPIAAPVSPARPVVRSVPKPKPVDTGPDLLDELSSLETAAPSFAANVETACPGCGQTLPGGAVICVACGFSLKTGARMAAAAIAVPRAKPAKKGKSGGAGGAGGGTGEKAWLYGGAPLLVLLVLFAVGRSSESVAGIFMMVYGLFSLAVGIWLLVKAFTESATSGILCLCLPLYSIYFVYAVADDAKLKFAYTAVLLGTVFYYLLGMSMAANNPNAFGLPPGF